jgi:hypothetical protein
MFYVLTEQDPRERRMDSVVGYFSKVNSESIGTLAIHRN